MPEPSQLVLLQQLPSIEPGTKVRFLACVHAYEVEQAQLVLRDRYPAIAASIPTAVVNVDNVLETVDRSLLEVGAWVNVIGSMKSSVGVISRESTSSLIDSTKVAPNVDALMMWSAGAIKLDKYKSVVQAYQQPFAPS